MQIILLERVGRLGGIGDEVHVRDGFARNFLLPQGKALRANAANRKRFEAERSAIEARNAAARDTAQAAAGSIDGRKIVIIRQAGENGQLYGSVSSRDVADALSDGEVSVNRSQVDLTRPIKTVGLHDVMVHLHAEVASTVIVNVARSQDEAERQAAGEDMTVVSYGEEPQAAPPAPEEVFEDGVAPDAADEDEAADDDDAEAESDADDSGAVTPEDEEKA
jgi:large subunit ribosomal protein L9